MLDLDALLESPLGVCTKGLPDDLADVALGKVGELGLSLWAGDLLLPALTLRGDRLRHNIARMMRFCDEHGVALAPHGKTTMAPQLFADQLDGGRVGHDRGDRRPGAADGELRRRADPDRQRGRRPARDALARRGGRRPHCLVDSVAGVEALDALGARRPVKVLVEVGIAGRAGRIAGAGRSACSWLEAAARARHVEPVGVECFEGVVGEAAGRRRGARAGGEASRPARRGRALRARPGARVRPAAARSSTPLRARPRPGAPRGRAAQRLRRRPRRRASTSASRRSPAPTAPASRSRPRSSCGPMSSRRPSPTARSRASGAATRPTTPASPPSCAPTAAAIRSRSTPRPSPSSPQPPARVRDRRAGRRAAARRPLVPRHLHPCGAFDRWRTLLEVDADYTVTLGAIRTFF